MNNNYGYGEDDYVAFLAYAGPPPVPSMKYGEAMASTQARRIYIDMYKYV